MRARRLNDYHGKPVYRFPIEVTFGETAAVLQINHYPKGKVFVTAHDARSAIEHSAAPLRHIPCVELVAFGPKGGRAAHRYWGWDTAIWTQMLAEEQAEQQLQLKW